MRAFLIAATVTSALLVGACASTSTPEGDKPAATPPAATTTEPQKPSVSTVDLTKPSASGINPLKDPNNILSKRSVYFEFDKFDVKEEYRPIVEAHAKYLRDNPSRKMLIQGNTDERGSREYNISLGQKRSEGVKKMMQLLGVREDQVESVSLGEEKPRAEGHDEQAWAQNRRSDILHQGEY